MQVGAPILLPFARTSSVINPRTLHPLPSSFAAIAFTAVVCSSRECMRVNTAHIRHYAARRPGGVRPPISHLAAAGLARAEHPVCMCATAKRAKRHLKRHGSCRSSVSRPRAGLDCRTEMSPRARRLVAAFLPRQDPEPVRLSTGQPRGAYLPF